jgi:regulator of sirC expression with transglutaminase-like and TPR domain
MDISEVRRRFTALIERPQGEFRLAEGALLIAQEEYPSLDLQAYLRRLDAMAEVVSSRLGLEIDPQRIRPTLMRISLTSKVFMATRRTTTIPATAFYTRSLSVKLYPHYAFSGVH